MKFRTVNGHQLLVIAAAASLLFVAAFGAIIFSTRPAHAQQVALPTTILVVVDDNYLDTFPRGSAATDMILGALGEKLRDLGYRTLNEEEVLPPRARREKVDSPKLFARAKQAGWQIDAILVFYAVPMTEELRTATIVNVTIKGRLLRSDGSTLTDFTLANEPITVPLSCKTDCLITAAGKHGSSLVSTLSAEKFKNLPPGR